MQQIEVCQKENRLGTAMNYRRALRRLDQFTGGARPAAGVHYGGMGGCLRGQPDRAGANAQFCVVLYTHTPRSFQQGGSARAGSALCPFPQGLHGSGAHEETRRFDQRCEIAAPSGFERLSHPLVRPRLVFV